MNPNIDNSNQILNPDSFDVNQEPSKQKEVSPKISYENFENFKEKYQADREQDKKDKKDINKRLDESNKRIDESNKRVDESNKRLDESNKRLDESNKRVDNLDNQFEFAKKILIEIMKNQNNSDVRQNNFDESINILHNRIDNVEKLCTQHFDLLNNEIKKLANEFLKKEEAKEIIYKPTEEEEFDVERLMGEEFALAFKKQFEWSQSKQLFDHAKEAVHALFKTTGDVKGFSEALKKINQDKINDKKEGLESIIDLNMSDIEALQNSFMATIKKIYNFKDITTSAINCIVDTAGLIKLGVNIFETAASLRNKYIADQKAAKLRRKELDCVAERIKKDLLKIFPDDGLSRESSFQIIFDLFSLHHFLCFRKHDIEFFSDQPNGSIKRKYKSIPEFEEYVSAYSPIMKNIRKYAESKSMENMALFYHLRYKNENFNFDMDHKKLLSILLKNEDNELNLNFILVVVADFIQDSKCFFEYYTKLKFYKALKEIAEFDPELRSVFDSEQYDYKTKDNFSFFPHFWNRSSAKKECEQKVAENLEDLEIEMRHHLKTRTQFDSIIKTKSALTRLQIYIDLSDSEYAKICLKKALKTLSLEFIDKKNEIEFEKKFEIYQNLKQIGKLDPESYIPLQFKFVSVEEQEKIISK